MHPVCGRTAIGRAQDRPSEPRSNQTIEQEKLKKNASRLMKNRLPIIFLERFILDDEDDFVLNDHMLKKE